MLDVLEAKNLNESQNLLGMFTADRSINAINYGGPNAPSKSLTPQRISRDVSL